ncbi:hypothetical protein IMZ48_39630 [Candidatus Bathyarchaeota archaeon]|nr:hypothetical protein [Candidatus Bathyarchaeota archaeon]
MALTRSQARLRREDFLRFRRALVEIQKAEVAPGGDIEGANAAALLIVSGDEDLAARFGEFLRSAHVLGG